MGMHGGKLAVVLVTGAAALGGGAYLLFGHSADERALASGDANRVMSALANMDNEALTTEQNERLRSEALSTLRSTPLEQVFDQLRTAKLSDEERDRLEANLRELMMEDMQRKVNDYFEAPEAEQEAVMDAHIDEMQKFMADMRAYHEKHKDDPDYQAERDQRRQRMGTPSLQERKQRMEGTNPDQMVRMFRYWTKMRERAQQRGIEMGPGQRGSR